MTKDHLEGADAAGERSVDAAMLRDIGLFGGLSDAELARLASSLEVREVPAGVVVFAEGDAGRELFLVMDGEVEVHKRATRGTSVRIALLGPRDWFGEMSLLDVQPRSASARVVAPARLVVVTARDLDALYRRDPKAYALFVLNVARELSRRLRVIDGVLADVIAGMADVKRAAHAV